MRDFNRFNYVLFISITMIMKQWLNKILFKKPGDYNALIRYQLCYIQMEYAQY